MKTFTFSFFLTATLTLSAIGCEQTGSGPSNNDVNMNNSPDESTEVFLTSIDSIAAEPLSLEEEHGLLYMREEEKLARDAYNALYGQWKLRPFMNISKSEQMHMTAVLTLLERYSMTDPVGINGNGIFKDTVLQNLYNALLVQGKSNVIEALKVGATIEEVDIVDLQKHLKETDNSDIAFVYNNLMRGSRNHLRAFVGNLRVRGITYTPQYLSAIEFDQIIAGSMERGCGSK